MVHKVVRMKYIVIKKKSYWFQKAIPNRLIPIAGKQKFVVPLNMKVGSTTENELEKARLKIVERFNLYIKTLESSDPTLFNNDELIMAASQLLESRKLRPELTNDPEIASDLLPEIDDIPRYSSDYTFQDKVVIKAYQAIGNANTLKERTLSSLLELYQSNRNYQTYRDKRRDDKRWEFFMSIIGEHILSKALIDKVHSSLDTYVDIRAPLVSSSTVERELNTICSVLNNGNRKYRLGWQIVRPLVPKTPKKSRMVLKQFEQHMLVDYCLNSNISKEVCCVILLLMQGGMMPSEVKRLKEDSICLDAEIPHLVVKGDTKTRARKRVVPLVMAVDFIKENIGIAIEWLNRTTDTNHSARIKKVMAKALNTTGYTGHCLRHAFKNNAMANGADLGKASIIAGWSTTGGFSEQMLSYGSQGLAQTEVLRGLYKENMIIHKHLMDYSDMR